MQRTNTSKSCRHTFQRLSKNYQRVPISFEVAGHLLLILAAILEQQKLAFLTSSGVLCWSPTVRKISPLRSCERTSRQPNRQLDALVSNVPQTALLQIQCSSSYGTQSTSSRALRCLMVILYKETWRQGTESCHASINIEVACRHGKNEATCRLSSCKVIEESFGGKLTSIEKLMENRDFPFEMITKL